MNLTLDGRVVPYTRMTQRGKWTPAARRYLDSQGIISAAMLIWMSNNDAMLFPKDKRLILRVLFRGNYSRCDLSNLVKAIEDAGNGFLWADDRQIDCIIARREPGEYRTEIEVHAL